MTDIKSIIMTSVLEMNDRGIINRFEDHDVNPAIFSKIVMPDDEYIYAQATDQKNLGNSVLVMT